MAQPIRVEFEGALYHLTARGNERRAIFRSDADRNLFLEALGQCAGEFGALVHAFCLMPNHYHLVLETPKANLSQTIGWLQTTYTIRFNRRHRHSGHLFQGRFKAHLVEADSYAMELLRSIHLNPVRPRDKTVLIASDRWEALQSFAWSSHRAYAGLAEKPLWLCTDWLSFFDSRRSEARRQYLQFIRTGFEQVLEAPWEKLRGGLVLGGEEFWEKVKTLVAGKPGNEELFWVRREHRVDVAAKRVAELLAQTEDERVKVWIRVRPGGERKVDVARSLGHRHGSSVLQVLKRLEAKAAEDPKLRR